MKTIMTMTSGVRAAISRAALGMSVFALSVMLVLSACATTNSNSDTAPTSNDVASDRAQLRWDSIFARDYDTAYSLYTPGYRSSTSRVDFEISIRLRRVKWTSAENLGQECSENRCVITFNLGYTVDKPVPGLDSFDGSNVIDETWIKSDGEWWYVPPKQ
jgi:hypothetical protein